MSQKWVWNQVLAIVIAGSFFSCNGAPAVNGTNTMNNNTENNTPDGLDRTTAYRYALAWARFEDDNPSALKTDASGDFFGTLGSIAFDYDAARKVLTTRATVQPEAVRLVKRP